MPFSAELNARSLTETSDPKYEEEVSGCTASVGIISKTKIYVVCMPVFVELAC
jgi:hypothetical protein